MNITQARKADFILEIGVEEIPSTLIKSIKESISSGIKELLDSNKLNYQAIISHGSPRRLYFEVQNLDLSSDDEEILLRGPATKIALTEGSKAENPSFTQAALSFAKKNDLSEQDLYIQDGYVFAKSLKKGRATSTLLEENLAEIIKKTPGKRFMRWSNTENKFTRPIEWISAKLLSINENTKLPEESLELNFNFEDIESSSQSFGHRIYGKRSFNIQDQKSYFTRLKEEHILLQEEERKEFIEKEANRLAQTVNGIADLDNDLLNEICGLVESPRAVLCEFSPSYLEVPALILKTVMKVHQRYIPIMNAEDTELLSNYFIVISNNPEAIAEDNIKAGNEKVIIPRFEDARFFLNEDNKTLLENRIIRLNRINFQVGNMQEKAERLQRMTEVLMTELEKNHTDELFTGKDKENITKAALLAKADLDTHLVFEFTELQGEIGGIYATRQGLDADIAKAISEQYMPRFAEDKEPESLGGKLIAIIDKLDNILAYFSAGKIPKGSADPFALRRQANGLLQIIVHSELKFDLEKFINDFIELNPCFLKDSEFSKDELLSKTLEFLKQRLEFVFAIHHPNLEINKAVLRSKNPLKNLFHLHKVIHLLGEFQGSQDYENFIQAVTRINNMAKSIMPNESQSKIEPSLFKEEAENKLYNLAKDLELKSEKNFRALGFATNDLSEASPIINEFFDKVLVNDPDPAIKTNRQNLILSLNTILGTIAVFSELN